jgi:hypothetical protein
VRLHPHCSWDPHEPGVLALPSGRMVRGRGLRGPLRDTLDPDFGLYLQGHDPGPMPWPSCWVRWPDFRLPSDDLRAREVLIDAWARAADERVEVACRSGRGRTGTALACMAVLDGVPGPVAVAYVREHYNRHAVETPWQRRYVAQFRVP